MSKESTPLEALKELKYQVGNIRAGTHDNPPQISSCLVRDMGLFEIIETALKNYKELTNKPVILCRRTHEEAQKTIDIICKNFKEVQITNLEDQKKLKALEIIKEKSVDVGFLQYSSTADLYNHYIVEHAWTKHTKILTQEEFDLLKEILK